MVRGQGVPDHIVRRRNIAPENFTRELESKAVDPKRELALRFCRGHALELLISTEYRMDYDEDAMSELATLCGVDTKSLVKEVGKCPKEGEKITVSAEQLEAFKASYSADKIGENKIKTPVEWRGRLWVATGSFGSGAGGTESVDLRQVVPVGEFKGKTTNYAGAYKAGKVETGGELSYVGIKVSAGGAEYVLASPKWMAIPAKDSKTPKPAKAPAKAKTKGKK
jgi:hypothetical protein